MTPLRIWILLGGGPVPLWVQRLLDRLRALSGVEIIAASFLPGAAGPGALFGAYFDLDRRFFHPASKPWEPGTLPELPVIPGTTGSLAARAASLQPDLLLNLALAEVPDELLSAAPLGVWSVRDAYSRVAPARAAGWREILAGDPITLCQVEVLQPGQPARIVAQAVLATDSLSVSRNQMRLLWRAASLVPRALNELILRGEQGFFAAASLAPALQRPAEPKPHQVAALALKQAFRKTADVLRKRFTFDQWMLMFAERPAGSSLRWEDFTPLAVPRGLSRADPFIVRHESRLYLFAEEFGPAAKRGSIVCLSLDETGRAASHGTVLERPYHLSYPFVFEHRGAWYMVPETAANRSIEIYRCTRFPDQWVFEKKLISNIQAVDATLIEHDGRWWMFANVVEEAGASAWDALHLFFAQDPLSETWMPHPLNPVVADVRSARPAGRIFLHEGRLYRPSQISTPRYGAGIRLNRIDTLAPAAYAETCVETFAPPAGSGLLGTHTLNSAGEITVIDVQRRRFGF